VSAFSGAVGLWRLFAVLFAGIVLGDCARHLWA
jgi:hypothetical protein